jgi:CheY-like chemotaxis protein
LRTTAASFANRSARRLSASAVSSVVAFIARTVAEAVSLGLLHKPDLAVLDLRLADSGLGTEIAAQLGELGRVGILYATGNATHGELTAADGDACLLKPYRSDDLLRSLQLVVDIVNGVSALKPFPRNFHLLRQPDIAVLAPLHA